MKKADDKNFSESTEVQKIEDLPFPTAMHAGYGFLLRWFFRRFFSKIISPIKEAEKIKELAARGVVVYVMAYSSFLSYLYFNWAYMINNLPLARFVNGIWYELYQPLSWWLRYRKIKIKGVTGRPLELETRLNWVTRLGGSSLIFLRKPRSLTTPDPRFQVDYILSLVRLQKDLDKPVFLYPQLLLYHKRPANAEPTLVDGLFGNRTQPTLLREVIAFILRRRKAEVRFGDPINIKLFLELHEGVQDEVIARMIRFLLNRMFRKERIAVTGPDRRVPDKMREMVLRDPKVRETMDVEAAGKDLSAVHERAVGITRKMLAELNYAYIDFMDYILRFLWRLMGVKLVYDHDELEPIREAARKGPLVLCPTHRSHLDYLIVSQIFYENGLVVPHIAAGDNLSFWPMGHIFRHMGAYFIRRSFKGDALYSSIFRAYMKRLLREGWTQEFFIEGTRSRTGKMLPPKLGMLSAIVDAYISRASDDVLFVPISIMYEKVVEEESYIRELLGGDKSKEDFKALLKTTGVLTSRYGNIYVRLGEPVSLAAFLSKRSPEGKQEGETLRKSVEALGFDISQKISAISIVAPSPLVSTVLLASRVPLSEDEIMKRVMWLLDIVSSKPGVRLSPVFFDSGSAVRECLKRLCRNGTVQKAEDGRALYSAVPKARLRLDYYKNSMLNFILPTAVASSAMRSLGGDKCRTDEAFARTRRLREILRYEFSYEVNVTFDELFRREMEDDIEMGFVEVDGKTLKLRENARQIAEMMSATLDNFLESYFVTLEAFSFLRRGPMDRKEFFGKVQSLGRAMIESGRLFYTESLSRQNIENALLLFEGEGILAEADDPSISDKRGRKVRNVFVEWNDKTMERIEALKKELVMFMGGRNT